MIFSLQEIKESGWEFYAISQEVFLPLFSLALFRPRLLSPRKKMKGRMELVRIFYFLFFFRILDSSWHISYRS